MSPLPPSIAPAESLSLSSFTWNNPVPPHFYQLDGRNHILVNGHNRFLEMHPQGVRTVVNRTEFCILTIMILNFTQPFSMNSWNTGNKEETIFKTQKPIHLIRSNSTGKYLCMNNKSVVYQSETNTTDCHFLEETENQKREYFNSVRYYREDVTKNKTRHWYIDFNKDNSVRCGNSTRKRHKGANFQKVSADKFSTSSPPFQDTDKPVCCTKKKCKKGSKGEEEGLSENEKVRRKTCKKLIRFCKKSRRNFFKLTLKKLRRYYKKCIQNRDKVRRCKKQQRRKKRDR